MVTGKLTVHVVTLLLAALPALSPPRAQARSVAEGRRDRPDLILYGGKVFTADSARPWAEAVAIRGERITAVGSDKLVQASAGPKTRTIDLKGRVVIPGVNDSHTHLGYSAPLGAVLKVNNDDWMQGPDPRQTLDALANLARTTPKGTWIRGQMGLKIRHSSLRRDALDKAAPDHPVILVANYGHGSMVNTRALRLLGVTDTETDPVGGWYERAPGTQTITGLLDGSAQYAAWNAYFFSDLKGMARTLRQEGEEALRYGITTLQHMSSPLGAAETVRAFREAALPVRVRLIAWPYPGRTTDWKRFRGRRVTKLTNVSGVKYVVDGTPIEQWALMKEEYPGRPGWHGRLYYTEDRIRGFLKEALKGKDPLMLHVVGDQATEIVFRLMEGLAAPSVWRQRRVRIEHAPGVIGPNIERARRLGVLLSQPRVGGVQIGTWFRAGIPLAHGSDGEPGNPWVDFRTATDGTGALSREEAARMFTQGSAYAEFKEREKGTLARGMLADLAVLSQDVFTVPAERLPETTSLLTIVGGKVEFDAGVLQVDKPLMKPVAGGRRVLDRAEWAESHQGLSSVQKSDRPKAFLVALFIETRRTAAELRPPDSLIAPLSHRTGFKLSAGSRNRESMRSVSPVAFRSRWDLPRFC